MAGAEKSFATVDGGQKFPRPSRTILYSHTVLASTLLLNLRTIMDVVLNMTRAAEQADFVEPNKSIASSTTSKRHFRIIQPLLASLLTMGLNYSADTICRETLGIVGDYLPSGLVWSVSICSHLCLEAHVVLVIEGHCPSSTEYVRMLYGAFLLRLRPGGFWLYVHFSECA